MFTYLGDLSTPMDQTRFLIGDTDPSAPLFQDGEIMGAMNIYGGPYPTAIALCNAQAMKYARRVTMSVDGLSVNYSDLAKQFTQQAIQLRKQWGESPGGMGDGGYVGGVSLADMETQEDNDDRFPSQFKIGKDDFPGAIALDSNDDNRLTNPDL